MKRSLFVLLLVLGICLLSACGGEMATSADTDAASTESDTETETVSGDPFYNTEYFTEPLNDDGFHSSLIAHAGGAVYGYRLTNSLEALDNAYANGFRIIELDFERTSDGKYVLLHDWDSMAGRMLYRSGRLTLEEFHASEKFAHLTLPDLDMLLSWLNEHRDCYIVTDAKCGNDPFLSELYTIAEELSERFIPQAYSYGEYETAKEIGFERVLLTLYQLNESEAALCDFAEKAQPFAITVPKDVLTPSLVSSLTELGIYTYAHTVNDLSFYEEWRAYGLYGIYTDYFCPIKWPYQ